jgi:ABC-type multidrug transport system permease subunit
MRLRDALNQKYPPPSRSKRLVKYMTTPSRLVFCIPASWAVAWLNYSHHVTEASFWTCYIAYIVAVFILFWLYELHHWAGGRPVD